MYLTFARRRRATAPALPGRGRHRLAAGLGAVALMAAGASVLGAGAAAAAPAADTAQTLSDVSLQWGVSNIASAGAYYGGCNFLSAGAAGDNGGSKLWTQTTPAPGYATQAGNVTILKPDAAGNYAQPTWASKCTGPDGTTAVTTSTSTGTVVRLSGGTGTVDPTAGTAQVSWTGSFTSVFYGGLVYWTATDPVLTVNADGTGTLTATLSGYGASMSDSSQWIHLDPATVTLADLSGVTVGASGFTVTPNYLGVAVTTGSADGAQVQTGTYWGSFPQGFIDYQNQTGESSYWYSSGLNDQIKPALPVTVGYQADGGTEPTGTAPAVTTQPADQSVTAGDDATFTAAASGSPEPTVQWQSSADGGATWTPVSGATSATLTVPDTTVAQSGTAYEAVFSNSAGMATSNPATLTVSPGGGTTPTPGDDQESITATIPEQAGSFSWTINGTDRAVTLDTAQDNGSYYESTGQLLPVTVTDTRSGGPEWSIAGQVGDFTGGLSGQYLGWSPAVTTAGAGATPGTAVTPGLTSGNGLKDGSTLAAATAGHDKGSATVGAGLDLQVPSTTPGGTYTALLTLTALS